MKWWNIIKETGAVLSTTAGIDSKPKYSDDEEEEGDETPEDQDSEDEPKEE